MVVDQVVVVRTPTPERGGEAAMVESNYACIAIFCLCFSKYR